MSNFSTDSLINPNDSFNNHQYLIEQQHQNLSASSSFTTSSDEWQVLDLSSSNQISTTNLNENKNKNDLSEEIGIDLNEAMHFQRSTSTPAACSALTLAAKFMDDSIVEEKHQKQQQFVEQQQRPSCFNYISSTTTNNDSLLMIKPQQQTTTIFKNNNEQITPLVNPFTSNAFLSMLQRHSATVAANKTNRNIFNNNNNQTNALNQNILG